MKTIGLIGSISWISTDWDAMLNIKPEDVSVPSFDTTYIHAMAAVEFALN